ncbi:MAG: peptide chain release factor 1 [Candidatus Omnitrophica bacterium]|nr:peptide chain release factor 1 [Candidatus Omnitrophota bacterium]
MVINSVNDFQEVIESKLNDTVKEYESLLQLITSIGQTSPKFKETSKKLKEIETIVYLKKARDTIEKRINETEEILNSDDKEIRKLAEDEMQKLLEEKDRIETKIKELLFPENPENLKNAIVELRTGVGGEESALFVKDLFRMYTRFCEKRGYEVEILSTSPSEKGGFKEVIFLAKGKGAYRDFKYESGVHRVQRIPETESYGRIHTSAATVAIFPEMEEQELKINPADLKIDTFRSSGAGGQSVNKTSSAVRITHIPTGIVVSCQDERSQMQNKVKALKILRARLQNLYETEKKSKIDTERKESVKGGDRSEKIRTYNFPQNRITDHRVGLTLYNLDRIIEGEMNELIETLRRRLQ